MDKELKLNPQTGCYEATFTISVEAEIFRRILFNYVEEQRIDPTDLVAWEQAIHEVARAGKWLAHPRAVVAPVEVQQEARVAVPGTSYLSLVLPDEEPSPSPTPPTTKYLAPKDEAALWAKARTLPEHEWESLLTPLPDYLDSRDARKRPFYVRRMVERKSLDKLKQQLKPLAPERMEAVAGAVNGNRLR